MLPFLTRLWWEPAKPAPWLARLTGKPGFTPGAFCGKIVGGWFV